ncbi:MAG TPA: rhomboid family intramembrane serine protease [bacterium]
MAGNTKRAILCPNCGKLISADTEKCIHCGTKNPGKFGLHSVLSKLFRGKVGFLQTVIYVCIGLFVLSILINPSEILRGGGGFLNFLSPSSLSLYLLGATGSIPMHSNRWWTLITAIYLHGSVLHILFNLLWVRQLGPMVEGLFGTARLIIIFTVAGIAGFILSNSMGIQLTIGASGSIFGLLGALIHYGRSRGGAFGEAMYRQLIVWAVILFMFGFLPGGRINNWAHLGGFIGGYLAAMALGYQELKSETATHRKLAAFTIIISVVAFLVNFLVLFI